MKRRRDLFWWQGFVTIVAAVLALAMIVSIMRPIDGAESRYPLTICLGVAASLGAILAALLAVIVTLRDK